MVIWSSYGFLSLSYHVTSVQVLNYIQIMYRNCSYKKVNCKVFPVHYAMDAYGGVDIWIHIFLTSALVETEWLASRHCHFTPGERAPVPIG
jgi:hypothetical protein